MIETVQTTNYYLLWEHMQRSTELLTKLTGISQPTESKYITVRRSFGTRLARLFDIHGSKYPDQFLLQVRRHRRLGICIYMAYPKVSTVKEALRKAGSTKPTVNVLKSGGTDNQFWASISSYDATVISDLTGSNGLELFVLTLDEKTKALKQLAMSMNHAQQYKQLVVMLPKIDVQSMINFNPWYQGVDAPMVVGIGIVKKEIPLWYQVLDAYATVTLFTKEGALNLRVVNDHVSTISCAIPSCVLEYNRDAFYVHDHVDPNFPHETNQNRSLFLTKQRFTSGSCFEYCIADSRHQRRFVFGNAFIIDEHLSRLSKTHVEVIEDDIWQWFEFNSFNVHYEPRRPEKQLVNALQLRAVSDRQYQFSLRLDEVLHKVTQRMCRLTIVAPKASGKSYFSNYMATHFPEVNVIDSDDFGIWIAGKAVGMQFSVIESIVSDVSIFDQLIVGHFLQGLDAKTLDKRSSFDEILTIVDKLDWDFTNFVRDWMAIMAKGIGSLGFSDYVRHRHLEQPATLGIALCHTHSEARLLIADYTVRIRHTLLGHYAFWKRVIHQKLTLRQALTQRVLTWLYELDENSTEPNVTWCNVIHSLSNRSPCT
ncbi:hypothetical protein [Operophtera brumata reovirus]|uniref:hypothetical protein n=1 Tax=Operophtera brumata reovirus TaxID=352248 RepID=UPI00005D683B|nr:hypothetical protein [Operophtera brumata reovirus]ABB17210.1 unknown [Operophtera brumata reovirus]